MLATSGDQVEHPKVADAASELFRDVFGSAKNPVRLVYGVASLSIQRAGRARRDLRGGRTSSRLGRAQLRDLGDPQHEKVHSFFRRELERLGDAGQEFHGSARRIAVFKATIPIPAYAYGFSDFFLSYAAPTPERQAFPRSEGRAIGRDAPPARSQERCKLGLPADGTHGIMVGGLVSRGISHVTAR